MQTRTAILVLLGALGSIDALPVPPQPTNRTLTPKQLRRLSPRAEQAALAAAINTYEAPRPIGKSLKQHGDTITSEHLAMMEHDSRFEKKHGSARKLESKLLCDVLTDVCKEAMESLFSTTTAATSEMCDDLGEEAAALCELVGGGPEDPFADACATIVAFAADQACEALVDKEEEMTEDTCKVMFGCSQGTAPPPPPNCIKPPVYIESTALTFTQPKGAGDCSGDNLMACDYGGFEYCSQLCEAEPSCVGFSLDPGTQACIPKATTSWTDNTCDSPSGDGWQYYAKGCPSADVVDEWSEPALSYPQQDFDCAGNSLIGNLGACGLSVAQCEKLCESMPDCMGFSFGGTGECIPKSTTCSSGDSQDYWHFYPKVFPGADSTGMLPGQPVPAVSYTAYGHDCASNNILPDDGSWDAQAHFSSTFEYCEQACSATANCDGISFGGCGGSVPEASCQGECILKSMACRSGDEEDGGYWYFFGKPNQDVVCDGQLMQFQTLPTAGSGGARKESCVSYSCPSGQTAGCNNADGQGVGSPNSDACLVGDYIYCY